MYQSLEDQNATSIYKKRFWIMFILFLVVTIALTPLAGYGISYLVNRTEKTSKKSSQAIDLNFNRNGEFKILQFTDLHYGSDGELADGNTTLVMEQVLDVENPDMVIITGDAVSGYVWPDRRRGCLAETEDPVKNCWIKLISMPMEKRKIPWVFVFGNHDRQTNYNTDKHMELFNTFSHYILKPAIPYFHLNINSFNQNSRKAVLWGFDSGQSGCYGISGWGCITYEQIKWYHEQTDQLLKEDGKLTTAVAYFHIATPEFMTIFNKFTVNGTKRENVGCSSLNSGIMTSFLNYKSVKAVFVGHDHVNDYFGSYFAGIMEKDIYPITLGYGRKTGYGAYGNLPHGGRVVVLHDNGNDVSWSTYIRLFDGSIIEQDIHTPNPDDPMDQQTCGSAPGNKEQIL